MAGIVIVKFQIKYSSQQFLEQDGFLHSFLVKHTLAPEQARIHTGLHRFTKNGQIFHKYIYYLYWKEKQKLSKLKTG